MALKLTFLSLEPYVLGFLGLREDVPLDRDPLFERCYLRVCLESSTILFLNKAILDSTSVVSSPV
jgi:hypothetical protein